MGRKTPAPVLKAQEKAIDPLKCMGKWYVLKNIPTYFEIGAHNAVELYEWDETKKRVQVTFEYRKGAADGPKATLLQHGWVKDTEKGTTWAVSPRFGCYMPFSLPYIILDCPDDYSHLIVGSAVGGTAYLWVMARESSVSDEKMDSLLATVRGFGYDMSLVQTVPQQW
eukprot:CAMPEP_0181177194 /NCGR_PEP_ID=MMETSP1096-20121128/5037_1 /TAXON_ID=156174 ORGANISM="Chrysochromulina ericina, Strain CCMP281" /NCGR_SAMPLE_ID=MMETSP1096 /ASSEMBLY_ACC=CAM_ASM_000453 /LENGTH=167 /DNA_ID=CAMNT_0023265341 /DNA_START=357 /DNA_END=860 /DNA_ORIENTATION=-